MLRIRPDLVHEHQNCETVPFGDFHPGAHRAWITKQRTSKGHIGSPQVASEDKGEALFAAFSAGVTELVRHMAQWDGSSWE